MSKFKFFGLVVLAMLVLLPAAAGAAPAQPDNYCTTVNVVASAGAFDVTATGAGRFARIRDLTANATVVATDFGSGATVYFWSGVALNTEHQYQVQVSHTSLTTGYSTTGCTFTPPQPQSIRIDRFEWVRDAFEWDALQDAGLYWVQTPKGEVVTVIVPAQSPGAHGFFTYSVPYGFANPNIDAVTLPPPPGLYELWGVDAFSAQANILAEYLIE